MEVVFMKYLLTLLIFLSSFGEQFYAQYDTKVEKAYQEYVEEIYDHDNYNYGIKLVKGIINEEVRYGFSFYNKNANPSQSYYVRIMYNDEVYKVDSDSRGDVQVVALNLKTGDVFSILVFETKTDTNQILPQFEDIKIMTLEEFNALEDTKIGLGEGTSLVRLKTTFQFDSSTWLYLGAFFIIVSCGLIIFFFYKRRKGLFSPDVRSENVFNFKEFLSSSFEVPNEFEEQNEVLYEEEVEVENEDQGRLISAWSRDEDESSGFDIGDYLRNRGYITNYQILGEEEKNQIMLELMHLRDQKIITKDDYLEEISKLWKE